MSSLLVVGAGPSGLGTATLLAEQTRAEVRLVDRIPVAGGEAGWDHPEIAALVKRAEDSGVRLDLGKTATRWRDGTLLLIGPQGAQQVQAAHLFFAGGRRPATAADLRITGERPAGVLPATVAEHLLSSGVALWRRPLIIGNGPWASAVAHGVHAYGGRVLALDGSSSWADEVFDSRGPVRITGRGRVEAVRVLNDGTPLEIRCDAVILASGAVPNRNVVGALSEGAASVTFVQPLDEDSVHDRFDAAQTITREWIRTTGGTP